MISKEIVRIVNKLADGLNEKPAYLLIFAIWVMFVIFGFGSGVYGFISDKPVPLYLAFLSFLISLIVAVIVIKIVEVPGLAESKFFIVFDTSETSENFKIPLNGNYRIIENDVEIDKGEAFLEAKPPSSELRWILPAKANPKTLIHMDFIDDTDEEYEMIWELQYYPQCATKFPPSPKKKKKVEGDKE